ncbi:ester cyclase [Streptomyces sp. NPDC005925]|uniref:nuclear transport factor 2 family protein n=1 Tax=Streptomyces sp. NPDC005925 TaxID=3157172 RepID=UPI0033E009E7
MKPGESAPAYRPYGSVEEYVLGCTDEIWTDRGIGLISSTYYAADVVVHGTFGSERGVQPVLEGTVTSISAYPDEVGRGEDVVWERRGADAFVSSHRVFSTATNAGWSPYGPPTHRRISKRALAHCLVRDGRIVEEWVVRDECRLVLDLGLDPAEVAARLAERRPWSPLELGSLPEDPLRGGVSGPRTTGTGSDTDCAGLVEMFEEVWNNRMLQRLPSYVSRDIVLHTTRGRLLQGHREYSTEILDLLAAFPGARVRVLDVVTHDDQRRGRRVSLVWLLTGKYTGVERFGAGCGQDVEILGTTQYVLADGKVTEEYRVYDELGLRIQIEQTNAEHRTAALREQAPRA